MNKGPVFIIAEAGVNHNGSLEIAKKLVDVARAAGADAVKFQTFKADTLVSKKAEKAEYQKNSTGPGESQYTMLKKLELSESDHRVLVIYCQTVGIEFMSTPFDLESVDFLAELGMRIFKIPSGEVTNLPYLRKVGRQKKKIILSTGMATMAEINQALSVLWEAGANDISVLHCNTEYPTPMSDVNLLAMGAIGREFHVPVGYSDHTLGLEVPVAAVALGAQVIEKHFTLDRSLKGPDHAVSLNPDELTTMVKMIRNIELAISGDGQKKPSASELKNIAIARRSIVAAKVIKKGEILTESNITTKRPGNGLTPMEWDRVIGEEAARDYAPDDFIDQ